MTTSITSVSERPHFLLAAAGISWVTNALSYVRRNIRVFNIIGGSLLVGVGILMVSGLWMLWMYQLQSLAGTFTIQRSDDYAATDMALADDGRLVMIAFLGGAKADINFAQIMMRRLTVTGSTLRPQSDAAKARIAHELCRELWPLVETSAVRPLIDSTYPLARASEAHDRMEGGAHIGKILLQISGEE